MYFREYGPRDGTPTVVALHGGPGAPGSAGALAHLLANPARVFEPWQEASTVEQHLADLRSFVSVHCARAPVLVGHSWGAMLALAFSAAHPTSVAAICIVGSGTFDLESRAQFKALEKDQPYSVDPFPDDPLDSTELDGPKNEASWNDMLRLQADGTYPATFARIRVPVLMLHGADDPHPGSMIRGSLAPFLPQLEYCELPRCGHYPWQERHARDEFLRIARGWLASI